MAVRPEFGLAGMGMKPQPVRQGRRFAIYPWRRRMVERCGKLRDPAGVGVVLRLFAAADPGFEMVDIRHQNDFGRPSTCVATWLRMRLVEIGAT